LPKLKALGLADNVLGSEPVPVRATLIGAVAGTLVVLGVWRIFDRPGRLR
jgi:hypothetical protein